MSFQTAGTEFEKPRGVSQIEVRHGFAQVHVSNLSEPIAERRLGVLKSISDAKISLDFLKLTQGGLSFVVDEQKAPSAQSALEGSGATVSVQLGCSIVLVHAVNIRDEEGLVARLVSIATRENTRIEHLADMHDRLLLVTENEQAAKLADAYTRELIGGQA